MRIDNDTQEVVVVVDEQSPLLDSVDESPLNVSSLNDDDDDDDDEGEKNKLDMPFAVVFYRIHHFICVISLALVTVAQALPPSHHRPIFITALIQFYILLASTIGIILEFDLSEWFVKNVIPYLENWVVRGFFYVFLGLFALEEGTFTHPVDETDSDDVNEGFFHILGSRTSSVILLIASIGLFITGSLYVIMGSFCMQRWLKKKSEDDYEKRLKENLGDEEEE